MKRSFLLLCSIIGIGIVCTRNIATAHAPHTGESPTAPHPITIGWVGDIVPSENLNYNAHVFDGVTAALRTPDIMMGNLEGTFATADRASKCTVFSLSCFAFRGDPSFANDLVVSGFDMVSLVNNHSYDFFKDGLLDTQSALDAAHLPFISPLTPETSVVVHGYRIGILGISSSDALHTLTDYSFITDRVHTLKATNDFVIVIFHGGAEGIDKTAVPGVEEYEGSEDRGNVELAAHTAIDAGADVVLGSGPHVLRKIERYKSGLIAYSLGNFEGGDGKLATNGILGMSGILTVTLSPAVPPSYSLTSVALSADGTPSLDPADTGAQLIEQLSK